jgi:hypothetical protein
MASNLRPRKAWLEIMICLEAQSHRLPLFDACIACDGIGPRYLPFCKSFFLLFSSCKSLCIFLFLSSTRAALAAANCILSYFHTLVDSSILGLPTSEIFNQLSKSFF